MGLLHRAAKPFVGEDFVAFEVDGSDLYPLVFVHHEGDVHRILNDRVVLDPGRDFGVAEALVGEVFLDESDVFVDRVVGEFRTPFQLQVFEQGGGLPLADSLEVPPVDPRPLGEVYLQVHLILRQQFGHHFHVREVALTPQARYRLREDTAWYLDRFSPRKTRGGDQNVGVEVFDADDGDVVDGIEPGLAVIYHRHTLGVLRCFGVLLGVAVPEGEQQNGNEE